jgi:hypothetical protein
MKRKLVIVLVLVFIAIGFTSCKKTCKTCKKVYYDGTGTYLREDGAAEYCGVELVAIDGRTIDLGSLGSAKWVCN